MVIIKLTVYQKGNLIRILKYAKRKVAEDVCNKKMYPGEGDYTLEQINGLIKIINGEIKIKDDYFDVSSKAYREKCYVEDNYKIEES